MAKSITPLKERFESKVDRNGPAPEARPELGPCWLWWGGVDKHGYGRFNRNIRCRGDVVNAHHMAWEIYRGPVPDGLSVDHLCKNRRCVNPDHLEPVTQAVNFTRGDAHKRWSEAALSRTHCRRGHPFSGDNLYINPDGHRECKECRRIAMRKYDKRRRPSPGRVKT